MNIIIIHIRYLTIYNKYKWILASIKALRMHLMPCVLVVYSIIVNTIS